MHEKDIKNVDAHGRQRIMSDKIRKYESPKTPNCSSFFETVYRLVSEPDFVTKLLGMVEFNRLGVAVFDRSVGA